MDNINQEITYLKRRLVFLEHYVNTYTQINNTNPTYDKLNDIQIENIQHNVKPKIKISNNRSIC
jgi:hypothetical protein